MIPAVRCGRSLLLLASALRLAWLNDVGEDAISASLLFLQIAQSCIYISLSPLFLRSGVCRLDVSGSLVLLARSWYVLGLSKACFSHTPFMATGVEDGVSAKLCRVFFFLGSLLSMPMCLLSAWCGSKISNEGPTIAALFSFLRYPGMSCGCLQLLAWYKRTCMRCDGFRDLDSWLEFVTWIRDLDFDSVYGYSFAHLSLWVREFKNSYEELMISVPSLRTGRG